MECFIRIGDNTLTIVEAHWPETPDVHIATMQDTFTQKETEAQYQVEQLSSEAVACDLVTDFMLREGPVDNGPMRTIFPRFCP